MNLRGHAPIVYEFLVIEQGRCNIYKLHVILDHQVYKHSTLISGRKLFWTYSHNRQTATLYILRCKMVKLQISLDYPLERQIRTSTDYLAWPETMMFLYYLPELQIIAKVIKPVVMIKPKYFIIYLALLSNINVSKLFAQRIRKWKARHFS